MNKKKVVLCVDDEDYILYSLKETLRQALPEDYLIETASNALEAEEIMADLLENNEEIPVLISDHLMPNKSGADLIIDLHRKFPKIKKILLTGQASTEALAKVLNEQCLFRFIAKPWNPQDLVLTLQQAIRSYQIDQSLEEKNFELEKALLYNADSGFPNFENLIRLLQNFEQNKEQVSIFLIKIQSYSNLISEFGMNIYNRLVLAFLELIKSQISSRFQIFQTSQNEIALLYQFRIEEALPEIKILRQRVKQEGIHYENMTFYLDLLYSAGSGGSDSYYNAKLALFSLDRSQPKDIALYSKEISVDTHLENYLLNSRIQESLKLGKVIPYFQGIYSNQKKKVTKYECLARIALQDGQILTPHEFLPVIRSTGNLNFLTLCVMEACLKLISKNNEVEISINVTESDLESKSFASWVEGKLNSFGIAPSRITFEVLEDIDFLTHKHSLSTLRSLKDLGCKIALDDFGIRDSNLARLLDLEPDFIKIDGIFIKNINTNHKSKTLVKGITELAHSIGSEVVAEYVSSEEIQLEVEGLGIEYSQGFFHSEPRQLVF